MIPIPNVTNEPLLELKGITKSFAGVIALEDVNFSLNAGEIHALMGENGAGKSTLIKVLTGVQTCDLGEIKLLGKPVRPSSPLEAGELGISVVFQEVNLIPSLSIAENIFLGRQPKRFGLIDWSAMREGARKALARLEIVADVNQTLGSCSMALQQMTAIARALDVSAKILVLDEPTSSLDATEVEHLFAIMKKLREEGMGIVFVTHFLDQVYNVCDRITVLRNGKLVGSFGVTELPKAQLVAKMMGKELAEIGALDASSKSAPFITEHKDIFLQLKGLARKGSIKPLNIKFAKGTSLGLAGLLGSGRTEIARLIFGLDSPTSGKIEMNGKFLSVHNPRAAIKNRIALLPEDRKTESIFPNLSLRENLIITLQAAKGWWKLITKKEQTLLTDKFINELRIVTRGPEQTINTLSGGNQQKVIISRWLANNPEFLMLDEPTRGIDVGAKAEIQKLVLELKKKGLSILYISSELDEVVRCSDNIVVLREREKVGELSGPEITADSIMKMIAGQTTTKGESA